MGRCWELRFGGNPQWHADLDPLTAETLNRGRQIAPLYAIKILTTARDRTCFAVSLYDAVDSVACLECRLEDSGSDVYVLAGT